MSFVKFAAVAAATLIATPALAQDADAPNFSGLKAAVITGYDTVDFGFSGVDNPNGLIYGATLGYDHQAGNFVVGVEAEAAGATTNLKIGGTKALSAGRDFYVGARAGLATGSTLFYAKAGYTNAHVDSAYAVDGENFSGLRLGAGAEQQFGDKFFGKLEYRYSNYEADATRHQIAVGVGVRF